MDRSICSIVGLGLTLLGPGCAIVNSSPAQESRKVSLQDVIAQQGFVLHDSNIDPFEKARLIIFGDTHLRLGDELSSIFRAADLKEEDMILVEQTPRRQGVKEFWETKREKYRGVEEFFSALAHLGNGTVVGVDAPRVIRNKRLYAGIQRPILERIKYKLEQEMDLHRFEGWVLYTDMRLCSSQESRTRQVAKISTYLANAPTLNDCVDECDAYISRNAFSEVRRLSKGARAFMIIGSTHLKNGNITGFLRKHDVKFVAYKPVKGRSFSRTRYTTLKEEIRKEGEKFAQRLLNWYHDQRVIDGSPRYKVEAE